ncbi:Sodium/sulfate symporter [Exidia glandulosa HHB12029]|uniref:Sodium/sulfate symporter n=1 Tax=Exidia glandulosa HHB12029 TaxID=1314781 RepID=A0A165GQH1_EXIGL|nr:Sodium/sulfate symporter [Exidia glandulosa HHB12029]
MKFSTSLKFNANPEWWNEYIAYDNLKKTIYELEKKQFARPSLDLESGESTALINGEDGHGDSQDAYFASLLDKELAKITAFYARQSDISFTELEQLSAEVLQREQETLSPLDDPYREQDEDGSSDGDDHSSSDGSPDVDRKRRTSSVSRHIAFASEGPGPSHDRRQSLSQSSAGLDASVESLAAKRARSRSVASRAKSSIKDLFSLSGSTSGLPFSIWTSKSDYAADVQVLFKRRITTLYINFSSLRSYVELNYSGFSKILKKYDKITEHDLKLRYMQSFVDPAPPFQQSTRDELAQALVRLVDLYAKCVTHGDTSAANKQLRVHQREHVVWERDTVWRRMIAAERRGDHGGAVGALVDGVEAAAASTLAALPTPLGRFYLTRRKAFLILAIVTFVVLLNVPLIEGQEENRCFAILSVATILWATEAIPLFVTSMAVPLLTVTLRVFRDKDGNALAPPDGTKYVFSVMFSPTIMLLIGGFTIASALSKTNIDRFLITRLLSFAGTRPSTVLLAFMGVACFASMWISNVAAPTLCFTLIRPILRTLPPKAPFAPAIILGIALAANIGGQSSPISSPQNLIALAAMDTPLDWLQWFAVALPVSFISIILIWLLLLASYRPSIAADGEYLEIRPIRAPRENFTGKQYWVTFVCLLTIALWCVEHSIENIVGDMGIIALVPIVLFFSTGVLKKEDFDQFLWTIVFLAMGGIALGKAVTSSGLLEVMDTGIRHLVQGMSLFPVVLMLSAVVLVVSTFISHTIASVLLVPIASEVGSNLEGNHARLLIFLTGLLCSTGMGMPVSGFPNQTAANQEDEMGQLYLTNVDFLKNGVPASVMAAFVVATVGFALSRLIGV